MKTKVYLDTFSGLVAAKVVAWDKGELFKIEITSTKKNAAYKRGEYLWVKKSRLVERKLKVRSGNILVTPWQF